MALASYCSDHNLLVVSFTKDALLGPKYIYYLNMWYTHTEFCLLLLRRLGRLMLLAILCFVLLKDLKR